MEPDLYARIWLDDGRDKQAVAEIVAGIVGGLAAGATVVTDLAEMIVLDNEDAGDEGLPYRYCLEIEPFEQADAAAFRRWIATMLSELRDAGFRAVAACGFEDEPPRWTGTMEPSRPADDSGEFRG